MLPDYYRILGVPPDTGPAGIKAAFRARARQRHPDRGGSNEEMRKVNEAWYVLGHPERRRNYDLARQGNAGGGKSSPAEEDIRQARQQAGDYPPTWGEFETWLDGIAEDFSAASYQKAGMYPWVGNSCSGCLFVLAGGIVGLILFAKLFRSPPPIFILWAFAGGAWLARYLHQIVAGVICPPKRTFRKGPANPSGGNINANARDIRCPACQRPLRISASGRVRCSNCHHEY